MGIDEKEIEKKEEQRIPEPIPDLSRGRTGSFGSAFRLWGLGLLLDWKKGMLVRRNRNCERHTRVATISKQCGVSGWAPPFWSKVDLKFELWD